MGKRLKKGKLIAFNTTTSIVNCLELLTTNLGVSKSFVSRKEFIVRSFFEYKKKYAQNSKFGFLSVFVSTVGRETRFGTFSSNVRFLPTSSNVGFVRSWTIGHISDLTSGE